MLPTVLSLLFTVTFEELLLTEAPTSVRPTSITCLDGCLVKLKHYLLIIRNGVVLGLNKKTLIKSLHFTSIWYGLNQFLHIF